jgi:CHAD domain-containing protein
VSEPTATFREVERKLRVHGLYRLPDLAQVDGSAVAKTEAMPPLTLTATYFDTGDLRLARSKVTLRRREGGVDDGWHLKLPADPVDPGVRDEVRTALSAGTGAPPRELAVLVLALTRGAPLEEVAVLRTERSPVLMWSADGTLIGELTDDEVSVLDGPHVAARFRELEVETRDGSQADIEAVVAALVSSGAVEGGLPSKAVRALGPAALAPPDVAEPPAVGPTQPAGLAVRAHLARNAAAFIAQDLRVRRGLPDAVHQMRVAARRLRSGLKTFAPLVEQDWAFGLRSELAWAAGELGRLRDLEVLEDRLLAHLAELPVVAVGDTSDGTAGVDRTDPRDVAAAAALVRRTFDEERARDQAELDEAMASERYVALLDALVVAANAPQLTPAAAGPSELVLPPLLGRTWRRTVRDARSLRGDGPDAAWHQTRIAAKQARYTAEALAPVLGTKARRAARRLEEVTELLGEHQDAVIAADTARRLASARRVTGTTGFVLGLLHERERATADAARRQFLRLWPHVQQDAGEAVDRLADR